MAVSQNTGNLVWGNYYSGEKVWQDYLRKAEDCIAVDNDEALRKLAACLPESNVFKQSKRVVVRDTLRGCLLIARGAIGPKQKKR